MLFRSVRWEFNPAPVPQDTAFFLNPSSGTVFDEHQPLWPVSYKNFAPRGSAAWRVRKSGRTVLRGGAGLYYSSSLSIATDLINQGPLSITQLTSGIYSPFSSLLSYGFLPGLRLPRLTEWNVTLDQAFGTHDVVSVGYVGSNGRRLLRREIGGLGSSPTALLKYFTGSAKLAWLKRLKASMRN